MSDTEQIVYTTTQARQQLGRLGKTKFWALVRAGEIPTFRWLGKTLVRAEDLRSARDQAFARRLSAAGARRPSGPARRRSRSPTPR
jgi:hypothetical protein